MTGRVFAGLVLAWTCLAVQAQPGTDIHLLDLQALDGGGLVLLRVTDHPGYDNQPHFSADSRTLYFTRDVDGQTDIHAYDVQRGKIYPLAQTPQSEYSPTVIPRRQALSVIQVEPDGRQRLWALPLNGEPPQLIFENIEPVGYHAWAGPRIALLFVLGDPVTLQLAGPAGVGVPIAQNIGRALVTVPGTTEVAYVQKDDGEKRWAIHAYDYAIDERRFLAATLPEREDFTIGPDGALWMGSGPRLYRWSSDRATWTEQADFTRQGLLNLTRLAASPDGQWLALVSDEAPPPEEPPMGGDEADEDAEL